MGVGQGTFLLRQKKMLFPSGVSFFISTVLLRKDRSSSLLKPRTAFKFYSNDRDERGGAQLDVERKKKEKTSNDIPATEGSKLLSTANT